MYCEETVKYEEEMGEFDYTDYKYVFRVPIDRDMEIVDYKVFKDSIVIRLKRRKRDRQNLLIEYVKI